MNKKNQNIMDFIQNLMIEAAKSLLRKKYSNL